MTDYFQLLKDNVKIMNDLSGFDVVMVCCSSSKQAHFWQKRLEKCRGSVLPKNCIVLSVEEDWRGGAGNALGTLYAFRKASALAQKLYSRDIMAELIAGSISVGLYHTAGKGTRLAPLPGSENNNKPGVKLPATISLEGKSVPMTILEAVIKQTGCYAKSRAGRLSVFWGDQVFIPTAPAEYTVTHHADILCSLGPMPSEEVWKEKGMDKYGLIAQNNAGNAAQVEKVQHSTAVQLLASLGEIQAVGVSLGSFSVSHQLLSALLEEFAPELRAKEGKLDSDPHLWMPMTLEKASYQQIMAQKGIDAQTSGAHFDRIAAMMAKFNAANASCKLRLFGAVDVGQGVCWWDYGQLRLFQANTLMMTKNTKEADLMRSFLGMPEGTRQSDCTITNTNVDDMSCISSSAVGAEGGVAGFVRSSVLSNVRCNYIEAEGCVLINVTADRIIAKPGSIIYNYTHSDAEGSGETVSTADGDVIVGVFAEDGSQTIIRSHLDTDGGKVWDGAVHGNALSFSGVYDANAEACPTKLQDLIACAHDSLWQRVSARPLTPSKKLKTSEESH